MPDIDRPAVTIEEKFLAYRRAKYSYPDSKRLFTRPEQLKLLWGSLGATKAEAERIQDLPVGMGTPMEQGADLAEVVMERASMAHPWSPEELASEDQSLVTEAPMEGVVDSASEPESDAPGPQPVHWCDICERAFGSGAGLMSHKRSKVHIARQLGKEGEDGPPDAAFQAAAAEEAVAPSGGGDAGSMDVDDELLDEE